MSTHILGVPASLPLYFTATALAKLAHQEGEVAIVKALNKQSRAQTRCLGRLQRRLAYPTCCRR